MARAAEALRIDTLPLLSEVEMDRRRLMVRKAHHTNQLEGIEPDPDMDHVFESFIRGEIEVTDLIPRIRALQALR
ncbi:antitoxin VbhA family protein [Rhizobium sp. YTU87027]|uniref:antitoxin VbhA family protein n=1 Tax=Rhizobium sp. YTU87027 TaxID=3417741 RepID=UPI003D68CA5B